MANDYELDLDPIEIPICVAQTEKMRKLLRIFYLVFPTKKSKCRCTMWILLLRLKGGYFWSVLKVCHNNDTNRLF